MKPPTRNRNLTLPCYKIRVNPQGTSGTEVTQLAKSVIVAELPLTVLKRSYSNNNSWTKVLTVKRGDGVIKIVEFIKIKIKNQKLT